MRPRDLKELYAGKLMQVPYRMQFYDDYNYNLLHYIWYTGKSGKGQRGKSYNDVIIMADTETSKKADGSKLNHVVAWTISLRAYKRNIVTLWGRKPSEFCTCLMRILNKLKGDETYIYFHNLAYDWVFLRQFLFTTFGHPAKQLNTKSHYPIYIKWDNGLTIKDSLILAQRSLEKWAKDLNVEHQKACGKWEYDIIRNQNEHYTADELEYIEHDTLAGVECIDKTLEILHKSIYSIPYTATGIVREDIRNEGKKGRARDRFTKMCLSYEDYIIAEQTYHGGFSHANRHYIDDSIKEHVQCYDFTSSYPYVLLSEKYPCERFMQLDNCSKQDILNNSEDYAYMFKFVAVNIQLRDYYSPMPTLQFSKCVKTVNAICDNGRILCADYIEIYLTEQDLIVIDQMYEAEKHICTQVRVAEKDYLPRWLTDYIYKCFYDKTMLKGGDPVSYAIAKAKVNSIYGCMVQKCIKQDIVEDYNTGEYEEEKNDPEPIYNKYVKKQNTILPYQWGVWCTAYAFKNLFDLGACAGEWFYSDTDSCYGSNWDVDKLDEYNNRCKHKLQANGYGAVERNGKEYWLGTAVSEPLEDEYTEFKVQGAKRYCGRCMADGELHITVAGVPKKGAKCLHNDINEFTAGKVFDGKTTGKLQHTYLFINDIIIDQEGNETGDSIDLSPDDYTLDSVNTVDWDKLFTEEIEVQVYEE